MSTNLKTCTKCNESKLTIDFNKDKSRKDGLSYWCKECQSEKNIDWYQDKNQEKRIQKSHDYYHNNKELLKPKLKAYKEKHKEYYCQYYKEYYNKNHDRLLQQQLNRKQIRRLIDIDFQLRESLSSRIRAAIKNNIKSGHTLELIGCPISQLRSHLESHFQPNMTWENYGKWHIDHIIPCSSFDLRDPEQQKKCFHYTNLQPLWAEDNLRKSNKIQNICKPT